MKFYDYEDELNAKDVMGAAEMGQSDAAAHRFTAKTGTSMREYRHNDVVISVRPRRQMTWGDYYAATFGIAEVFRNDLKNETSFDILQDGVREIGTGAVIIAEASQTQ